SIPAMFMPDGPGPNRKPGRQMSPTCNSLHDVVVLSPTSENDADSSRTATEARLQRPVGRRFRLGLPVAGRVRAVSNGAMPTALFEAGAPDVLYLIDLSSYVLRAYQAIAPLSSPSGEPTQAVHGTVN